MKFGGEVIEGAVVLVDTMVVEVVDVKDEVVVIEVFVVELESEVFKIVSFDDVFDLADVLLVVVVVVNGNLI